MVTGGKGWWEIRVDLLFPSVIFIFPGGVPAIRSRRFEFLYLFFTSVVVFSSLSPSWPFYLFLVASVFPSFEFVYFFFI